VQTNASTHQTQQSTRHSHKTPHQARLTSPHLTSSYLTTHRHTSHHLTETLVPSTPEALYAFDSEVEVTVVSQSFWVHDARGATQCPFTPPNRCVMSPSHLALAMRPTGASFLPLTSHSPCFPAVRLTTNQCQALLTIHLYQALNASQFILAPNH
jgi:hypothetical protein